MHKGNIFFIIYFIYIFNCTQQSHVGQGISAVKAIGRTVKSPLFKQIRIPIKNSMNKLYQNHNTIKNLAYGVGDKQQGTRYSLGASSVRDGYNLGSSSVRYFGGEGIRQIKYKVPWTVSKGAQAVKKGAPTGGATKKNIFIRTYRYMVEWMPKKMNAADLKPHYHPEFEKLIEEMARHEKLNPEKGLETLTREFLKKKTPKFPILKGIFQRYTRWLKEKPLKSRIITSLSLAGLGDVVCQTVIEKQGLYRKVPYDWSRTIRMSVIGGFVAGPLDYGWLNFVLPKLTKLPYLRTLSHWPLVGVMMVFDQTFGSQGFNASMLFQLDYQENYDAAHAWKHQNRLLWKVIKDSWKVWPAVQFINLGVLPPLYRLPVINLTSMFWNIYMSNKNQKGRIAFQKEQALAKEQALQQEEELNKAKMQDDLKERFDEIR